MEEHGHAHGHRGHSSGFHWLDISLAVVHGRIGIRVCYCPVPAVPYAGG